MQRTWKEDRTYLDVEGVIYHYPRPYFDLLDGYERFVYYRPSSGAVRNERSAYIGYGTLAQPYPDPANPNRRFVDVRQYKPIRPVPFADSGSVFFESGFTSRNAFQGRSVRAISEVDFIRILVAAGIYGNPFEALADTEAIGTILQESHIAFVALDRTSDRVVPLNERARALSLFVAS